MKIFADKINPMTRATGKGPLSFNVEMARRHGWTDAHIQRVVDKLESIIHCASAYVRGQHPELYGTYGKGKGKTTVYIGPDEDGHVPKFTNLDPIRGRKPKKPDRRAGERRATKRRTDDKRKARLR
jgi:hypothetical protein